MLGHSFIERNTLYFCLLSWKDHIFYLESKVAVFASCLTTFMLHGLFCLPNLLKPWPPKQFVCGRVWQLPAERNQPPGQLLAVRHLLLNQNISKKLRAQQFLLPQNDWVNWCEKNPTGGNKPHKRKSLASFTKLAGSLTTSTISLRRSNTEQQTNL